MKKNLIISAVGDKSYHKEWVGENQNYDVILIYYGDDMGVFNDYKNDAMLCIKQKGMYYPLIHSIISSNIKLITQYDYVWLPDDDISTNVETINKLFQYAVDYDLYICQPSIEDNFSHFVTKTQNVNILRHTNFVEGMLPLFNTKILLKLYDDFVLSDSGWGLDVTWSKRLGDPTDKFAIIDDLVMKHMNPPGSKYNRLKKDPHDELYYLCDKYDIQKEYIDIITYDIITK